MKSKSSKYPYPRTIIPVLLFAAALVIFALAGCILKVPGYMDAEYYYLGAKNLSEGNGFNEMIIWNYLDDPSGLPHPSNSYWMPFTSILAASGLLIFQNNQFIFAQIPFILMAAFIPLITYFIAKILYQNSTQSIFAAVLALFPGYYLAYYGTTATITPYFVIGGLFTLLVIKLSRGHFNPSSASFFLIILGGLAGLMHLTRSDGVLWLLGAVYFSVRFGWSRYKKKQTENNKWNAMKIVSVQMFLVAVGYLLVMLPWFFRNFQIYGQPLPPGGFLTIWLTDYNQTFIYPSKQLNFGTWNLTDLWTHIIIRVRAFLSNIASFAVVEGEIILLPFLIIGAVKFFRRSGVQTILLIWFLTLVLMSVIFPFAGMRGGYLHASAGFQSLFWALVPAGFETFIRWGVNKRNWVRRRTERVFRFSILTILLGISLFAYYSIVFGSTPGEIRWRSGWMDYANLEERIIQDFPDKSQVIIVNNPPGYFLASNGRSAIVIPEGNLVTLKEVAQRYDASIVAIDHNIVDGLIDLYHKSQSYPWLRYLYTIDDTNIYQVNIENNQE